MVFKEKRLEVLHDHYKDTFTHIQSYLKLRDRLLVYVLLVVAAMLFQIYSTRDADAVLSEAIKQKFGVTTTINTSFIGSLLWFALLALLVRYYQAVVHVDRQYRYIHGLEKSLNPIFGGSTFTREGSSYKTGYPLFSGWTHILYTFMVPVILMGVVVARLVFDFSVLTASSLLLWVNLVIAISIYVSTVLYVIWLRCRE